jgi:hypothetical protein
MRHVTSLTIGAIAAIAFFGAAMTATAATWTVNRSTSTATATGSITYSDGSGNTITCTAASLPIVFPGGTSTGTIAAGQHMRGCTVNGVPLEFVALSPWTVSTSPLLSGSRIIGVRIVINLNGLLGRLQDAATSGFFCRWGIGGSQAGLANATVSATPPALASLGSFSMPGLETPVALGLTWSNQAGTFCPTTLRNGLTGRLIGNFTLSEPLTATLA